MALTKIQAGSIESGAITTTDLSANTTAAFAVSLSPKITTVNVANSAYTVLDDTAVNTGGGYIVVTGSDFQSGAVVLVDTTQATSTTFVNSTTLRAQLPSKSAGTYNLYVANPDGGVGIKLNGVNYSASPIWITTSPLPNVQTNTAFTGSFSATGATAYANTTALPAGMTLVGANGYYYGTISVGSDTTYSFTINATDAENQDSPATFNLSSIAKVLDTYFNSTTLLLTGNGTNNANNNVFQDSSNNALAITRNGNTTQGSFSPFSPTGWSNYFGNSENYLNIASNSAFAYGTGNFTWECWIYLTSITGYVLDHGSNGGTISFNGNILVYYNATAGIGSTLYTTGFANSPALNTWHHISAVRNSGTTYLYFNGVLSTSAADSHNYGNQAIQIGNYGSGGVPFYGYISNLRLVKGTAVYTSNFTPPTAPLTAITNTSLLTCQSNRFIDNSTNNFTITKSGNISVQAFSPFVPETVYSPTTHGGSAYFDGTGDTLTLTASSGGLGSGDFTLEFWWYPNTNSPGSGIIFNSRTGGTEADGIDIYGLAKATTASTVIFNDSTKILPFSWNHVAYSRSGSTMYRFINGVADGTYSINNNFSGTSFSIGGPVGKISGLKHVRGTALYTSAFTPPTTSPTATANTQLLLTFTNAGIYDATAKNVLETVGDVKANTTTKKYGTGSMSFDGTGDYILVGSTSSNPLLTLDSNFTVEGWFNITGVPVATYYCIFSYGNTGLRLFLYNTQIRVFVGASQNIDVSAGTVNATWRHFALVRNGSTVTLYLDGSSVGSYSDSTSYTGTLTIGGETTSYPWIGYIDDFRITKGVARYTSNFTPPTAELPT